MYNADGEKTLNFFWRIFVFFPCIAMSCCWHKLSHQEFLVCSFSQMNNEDNTYIKNKADPQIVNAVRQIAVAYKSLAPIMPEIWEANIGNLYAIRTPDGKNAILYDKKLLDQFRIGTKNPWSPWFILAHEYSHIILSHTLHGPPTAKRELAADYQAATILLQFDPPPEKNDLESAMAWLDAPPGATHPSSSERKSVIDLAFSDVQNLPDPMIKQFEVNPETIRLGDSAKLSWLVKDSTKMMIDSGVGPINESVGFYVISPTKTTHYTLTASSGKKRRTRSVTVKVFPKDSADQFRQDVIMLSADSFINGQGVALGGPDGSLGKDVLLNGPPYGDRPNAAEWEIVSKDGGLYRIKFEYAAAESRPCTLFINGELVGDRVMNQTTGCWEPQCQTVIDDNTNVKLRPGKNNIRIERKHVFPHIRRFWLEKIE